MLGQFIISAAVRAAYAMHGQILQGCRACLQEATEGSSGHLVLGLFQSLDANEYSTISDDERVPGSGWVF